MCRLVSRGRVKQFHSIELEYIDEIIWIERYKMPVVMLAMCVKHKVNKKLAICFIEIGFDMDGYKVKVYCTVKV